MKKSFLVRNLLTRAYVSKMLLHEQTQRILLWKYSDDIYIARQRLVRLDKIF